MNKEFMKKLAAEAGKAIALGIGTAVGSAAVTGVVEKIKNWKSDKTNAEVAKRS